MSPESVPDKPRGTKQRRPVFHDGRTNRPIPAFDLSQTGEGRIPSDEPDKPVDPEKLLAEIQQLKKIPRSSRFHRK